MIELALLALMHVGYEPVIATRTVAADAADLDAYLTDPAHERRLLGAPARVRPSRSQGLVTAQFATGLRNRVWATWILTPGRGTTEVTLAAQVEPAGLLTQIALLAGGRRRLSRRLEAALATLATVCTRHVEDVARAPQLAVSRGSADPLGELLPAASHGC